MTMRTLIVTLTFCVILIAIWRTVHMLVAGESRLLAGMFLLVEIIALVSGVNALRGKK